MPLGGKLVLKGGETLGVSKPKKKKKAKEPKELALLEGQEDQQEATTVGDAGGPSKPQPIAPTAVNVMSGKNYEQEFEFEAQRMQKGRQRNTPWGSTYRPPPEILHGYTHKVTGKTAEERLDMRASTKTDRFCK